ncbi:MAG: bifunctional uroporphyrinogen-III C-methyltransferase/uroporphyrinogen-III synthase [Corynebacteriales bacterium]|nr:bifunctional uroporphyrinogen-III C-methyltransferase/uroporphyrinogen-III synthase [Mycobacteriales bacterium]
MSRRKPVGRISFVGVGPGDPGLLTRRALAAIAEAEQLFYDSSVPEQLLTAIRETAPEDATFTVVDADPAEAAKNVLAGARAGTNVARLVHGDVMTNSHVAKEVQAVTKTVVPFEVLPGVNHADGVATYAGTPLGGLRTIVDVHDAATVDFAALPEIPGSLVITVDANDLTTVRNGLIEAGFDPANQVSITGEGTTEIQSTSVTTLESVADAAIGLFGRLVLTFGAGVAQRGKYAWWESRALYGWKVLVPRTKEQAGSMSARLRVWGAIPCEVPTIAVEPPRTPAQMERAIKGLVDGRYAWVVFTSANAVRAVWEKFGEHGLDARHFGGVRIACIGEATADAVRAFGIQPELIPSGEHSSEGLLEDFPPYDKVLDPIDRILLPRADIATEILAAGLQERGWEIDDVTAYRTVRAAPPPADIRDAIKSGGFDMVLFTSSSTVRNLVGIAGKPHARTVICCIGPKTAETARELGLRVDVQPEEANVEALIESSAEYALELREKMANMTTKPRRGAKIQGPTAGRLANRG